MILVLLTFLLTAAGFGFVVWLVVRRIVEHLRNCPAGVAALSEHLFMPVIGKKQEYAPEPEKPETESQEDSPARKIEKGGAR
jgi:hypothetical protein